MTREEAVRHLVAILIQLRVPVEPDEDGEIDTFDRDHEIRAAVRSTLDQLELNGLCGCLLCCG